MKLALHKFHSKTGPVAPEFVDHVYYVLKGIPLFSQVVKYAAGDNRVLCFFSHFFYPQKVIGVI